MNRISDWDVLRAAGGRENRYKLCADDWQSKLLALGAEGNKLSQIEGIMTAGHDQEIRNKWDIGHGLDTEWKKEDRENAKATIWEFFKDDIVSMYQGRMGYSQTSPGGIVNRIKSHTGFVLPESTMLNQLRAWNVPIIGRGGGPSVAKSSRPLNNGRASQIPKRTKTNANTNTNNTTNPNPNLLVRPQHPSPAAGTSYSPLDRSPQAISVHDPPQDASLHSSSDGNDTMSQLERVIQRFNILDAEAKAYKQHIEMQNQGMQTQQQKYDLVHAMAEQNARTTEETKTQMLKLQNRMNQMQEDNSALRVEITELRNENQALRFEINQYKLQIFQQEKEMADLRDQSHVMRNNYHSLLHTFGDLKREKEALLQQKEAEANLNIQLKQHIREFLKIFSAPYTRCLKYDVERLATSLTKLNLEDDRRRSRDSGFFSGSQSNDSNRLLSVNDYTSRGTNPKRPRHETGPPQMERSVSDGQYGNSPSTHASRNRWPLTEPQSLDTRSIISRHEDLQEEEIGSVAPQTTSSSNIDQTVKAAEGGHGWSAASPSNQYMSTFQTDFDPPFGELVEGWFEDGNFIYGSSDFVK